jgi:hypothetical protein
VANAVPAVAQGTFPTFVTSIDPSIQSAGMGGATAAVFWQDLPNTWINPALAAFHRGIRYSYGTTELLPDLTDYHFRSHQILLGAYGLGVETSGKPFDSLGKSWIDYGTAQVTDDVGNVIAEFDAWEEARALAIGVDLVSVFASIQEASSGKPSVIRQRLSVAVGHAWKDIVSKVVLNPVPPELDVKDFGALVRVTALDQIGNTLGDARSEAKYRVEVGAGYSKQNYGEDRSSDIAPDENLTQYGASVRLTAATPTGGHGVLRDFATPALALGLAWTLTDGDGSPHANQFGAEASLWDLILLRAGYVNRPGVIEGPSFGGGVALAYRQGIGARFDYARYPQADDLSDLDRFQVTAFFDPVALFLEDADAR